MTTLDICNIALSYVGADAITSLTEDSNEARWCNANYTPLKEAVLSERTWSFAEEQLELENPSQGAWGVGYLYSYPADIVRIYRCYESVGTAKRQAKWQRQGSAILADYNGTLYALGTSSAIDEAAFPPMFVQALAARLAMDMAVPIARNAALMGSLIQLYEFKLSAAAAADGTEGRTERHDSTELTAARNVGGYSL